MKTLMIDMDNVITDGNVLDIISNELGREVKVGDTFYLQNLIEKVMVPWETAINMVSLNAARYLGVDDRKGKVCAGYDADLVVLDKDFEIVQVYQYGKAVK